MTTLAITVAAAGVILGAAHHHYATALWALACLLLLIRMDTES